MNYLIYACGGLTSLLLVAASVTLLLGFGVSAYRRGEVDTQDLAGLIAVFGMLALALLVAGLTKWLAA